MRAPLGGRDDREYICVTEQSKNIFTVCDIHLMCISAGQSLFRPGSGPGGEKLVQLLERLAHPTRAAGGDGRVESVLRGMEVVHDDQRLATSFFEGHRGDGPTFTTFVIRPDESGVRRHFDVPTEERHRLLRRSVAEHETVGATR